MHFAIDLWYNNYAIISTYLCAMAVIEYLNDQMQFDTVLQKKPKVRLHYSIAIVLSFLKQVAPSVQFFIFTQYYLPSLPSSEHCEFLKFHFLYFCYTKRVLDGQGYFNGGSSDKWRFVSVGNTLINHWLSWPFVVIQGNRDN